MVPITNWFLSQNGSYHKMVLIRNWFFSQNGSYYKMVLITKWFLSQNGPITKVEILLKKHFLAETFCSRTRDLWWRKHFVAVTGKETLCGEPLNGEAFCRELFRGNVLKVLHLLEKNMKYKLDGHKLLNISLMIFLQATIYLKEKQCWHPETI